MTVDQVFQTLLFEQQPIMNRGFNGIRRHKVVILRQLVPWQPISMDTVLGLVDASVEIPIEVDGDMTCLVERYRLPDSMRVGNQKMPSGRMLEATYNSFPVSSSCPSTSSDKSSIGVAP